MMILVNNGLPQDKDAQKEFRSVFCRLLNPFAPHLAEELWQRMHKESQSVFHEAWPEFDEAKTIDNTIVIGVQVLGKLRGEIEISKDEDKDSVLEKAKSNENVAKWLE
jgi:leucyl-tRNA synthetase